MTETASTTTGTTDALQVGVTFGPTGLWTDVVEGTLLAERLGLDAVGFWDHYHS